MKVRFWVIGKTAEAYLEKGMSIYEKRLPHYLPFQLEFIPDIKQAKNLDQDTLKIKEGELVLKKLDKRDFLVLLDEQGKMFRSIEFAAQLEKWSIQGIDNLVFLIGGAYGFSEEVYQRANFKMSLSPMTFSHQMVRLIFLEQLYRACSINKGEPYHHE
ncbi:MAG: 23S rRNA (pseudouridine(1915)-N(3))-methyltransferase RlmH [Bacteroidota bacterium]|nr:23S rRNA (pseudouridine(1915)-N(3))-methyltransferase RlmH [Bacteroidota bacterium]MDX5431494.1 23S rRNA (pseudouridine(1915)-N(3))-methyltransferase RlmH [Bacteroidota bacterium]MDX5470218.1 23S rRNA (pseudouridine(1915)-N(3))-methyltransferase RlmH [Bacteroidota bacterium]